MITLIHIHPDDNVAVAVERLEAGATVSVGELAIRLREPILAGHKVALRDLDAGAPIIKYGFPIGSLSEGVVAGGWVHSHNLKTGLGELLSYHYRPALRTPETRPMPYFDGYRRSSGRVGTRNEIWVLNTVGCVNRAAERIAQHAARRFGDRVDGFHAFSHPYGCSQLGDDLQYTQRVLAGLMRHPNAGGVLVLGLGCENNQMADLMAMAGDVDPRRMRFFNSQEVLDEVDEGLEAVGELVEVIAHDQRVPCPASDLVLGLKCGGSDGFSGLTANPLVGHVADRLTDLGGTALLTEVPEMFGAEQVLMNRAQDEATFAAIGRMINDFKQYFIRHDQPIYENPSPGNKDGGLTTLEEKSLGAIQKGGRATITQVLRYGEAVSPGGLALLEAPGNDGVSSTAMTVSGATILLFTTGRGTPLGFPAPTVKIATNSAIAHKKPHWIDFNAGRLLEGSATMAELTDDLFAYILDLASGRRQANNESNEYREIAIWKDGVTL